MAHEDPTWNLWHLAAQGSAEAYRELRQLYQGLVRAELQRRCFGVGYTDLEDLEQEVWIAVWRALPGFEGRAAFETWLVAVTKNVLRAMLRHKRSNERTLLRLRQLDSAEPEQPQESERSNRLSVSEAVDRLSEREHHVIALRYFHQLSDREIASRLQVPLGTVKGRIRSGLIRLRESYRANRH